MKPVCASCRGEIQRWEQTSPSQLRPSVKIASGATYDDTLRGVGDNCARRYEDWRDLVLHQIRTITKRCHREHDV